MNSEMLPADIFTRPRGWRAKLKIKQYLGEDESDEAATEAAKNIHAALLRALPDYPRLDKWERLACGCDCDDLNTAMDRLYDYADAARIWIE